MALFEEHLVEVEVGRPLVAEGMPRVRVAFRAGASPPDLTPVVVVLNAAREADCCSFVCTIAEWRAGVPNPVRHRFEPVGIPYPRALVFGTPLEVFELL